jgi:monothiol glutaredoxin
MSEIEKNIKEMIASNDVVLFMKGNPHQPQCGFSAKVVNVLKEVGKPFGYVDVLSDPEVRANLPKVSDWPTFPQLFVKGELVGGCDIITEMHEQDELAELL